MPIKECTLPEGGKGWKWGDSGKCYADRADAEKQAAAAHASGFAMDRKTVRTVDDFGRMHVELSNISKAMVCPYYGAEIPGYEALGLDGEEVYYLLRDPVELANAAATFNNLPILSKHIPVTAEKPSQELVVGSTGTDCAFDEPYLRNSLVIWEALSIAGINTDQKRQLSSAYSYEADMTPGNYGGVKYDGIMRNIKGNHVALVEEGRAGPDVMVGDSKLLEKPKMKLSTKALALLGALAGYSATVIAQDAQIGDLRTVVGGVKSLKTEKERKAVIAAFTKLHDGKLAQDAELGGLAPLVAAIADADDPTPEMPNAMDNDGGAGAQVAQILAAAGVAPEIIAQIQALCSGGPGMDEFPPKDKEDGEKVDKPAMDAAIAAAVKAADARALAVRTAEIEVQPIIGTLAIAQDSAESVYKLALDHAKIELTDVPPSAYRALVGLLNKQRATIAPAQRVLAQDAAVSGASSFAAMFPNAGKVKGA